MGLMASARGGATGRVRRHGRCSERGYDRRRVKDRKKKKDEAQGFRHGNQPDEFIDVPGLPSALRSVAWIIQSTPFPIYIPLHIQDSIYSLQYRYTPCIYIEFRYTHISTIYNYRRWKYYYKIFISHQSVY